MHRFQPTPFWLKSVLSSVKGSERSFGAFFSHRQALGYRIIFLLLLFAFFATDVVFSQPPESHDYANQQLARAIEENLHESRYWHLLLHYREDFLGGVTSEVDDPDFFLSPIGKTDPKAELSATIRHFFSTKQLDDPKQPVQCAFIARFHWLQKQLSWDQGQLPSFSCERFDAWFGELNAQGISLIFPSAYITNPASMFGHTFLRIDQKGQTEHTRILAYTINYAADVPPNAGIEFAFKGIFGGYQGKFSSPPYYVKVKEYRDLENRDIWEYQLDFTEEQIQQLLRHTWELGRVYFDYFFFKENCAYHILSLLEVAQPHLHLTNQFTLWTVPTEAIKLISRQSNLVREVTYRPSHHTQIKRKREALSEGQVHTLNQLVEAPSITRQPLFQSLDTPHQRFLLDLGVDYLQYRRATDKEDPGQYKIPMKELLLSRSRLGGRSRSFPIPPYTSSPETGHATSRASLGIGWRQKEFFEEIGIRAGSHDLLDPDAGYTQDTQLQLASFTFRHYSNRNQFRLENFTLANIVSLVPMDSLFMSPSWKFTIGLETIRFKDCRLCSNGNMNVGIGAATETRSLNRELFFVFAELDGNVSSAFRHHHRIGAGITGGMLISFIEPWKVLTSISYLGYPVGEKSDDLRISIGQRWTLSQNWAVRTEFTHRDRDNQITGMVQAFF